MKYNEIMKKALDNTTVTELIAIINNEEITVNNIEDKSRVQFLKRNIKSIIKSIIDSQF